MSDTLDKPLITATHPGLLRPGSRPGRILSKLHASQVVYRFRHGGGEGRELAGAGQFFVEIREGNLRCRVLGDLFKPGPCEFAFHRFWLTRRGMMLAVFGLAESMSPGGSANSGEFIHFANLQDPAPRREAAAFRQRSRNNEQKFPS